MGIFSNFFELRGPKCFSVKFGVFRNFFELHESFLALTKYWAEPE